MYLTSANVPGPSPFPSASLQFTDVNAAVQQQQQQQQQQMHYTLLNYNPVTVLGPTTNQLNTNLAPSSSQSFSSQTNDSLQQQQQQQQSSSQLNPTSFSTLSHPSVQQIVVDSLYDTNVRLREKNPNQLYDSRKTRKRLSDPVYSHHYQQQQQQSPMVVNHLQSSLHPILQAQPQQYIQNNLNLPRDSSNHSLTRRRSLRFIKAPSTLETILQQPSQIFSREPQKLLVVRHAERVDSTFGSGWLDQVFDKSTGVYRRSNLNLPKRMVTRRDLKDFLFDPPITELGLHESKMIGEELAAQGIKIHHVYASPALRCVQTADKILEGLQMRDNIAIRIEPCLFEFLKWYPMVPVKWPFLDLDELTRNGYNVDKSYKPFYPMESLRKDEDESMFYARSHLIVTSILRNHNTDEGNVLLVGHVSSSNKEKKKTTDERVSA